MSAIDPRAKLSEKVRASIGDTIDGQCHCGQVKFRLKNVGDKDLDSTALCNCSICVRHGAVEISVLLADFELLTGQESLTLYQFGTRVAKHYFCSRCGIYTHHQCRNAPDYFAVNVGCLDSLNPYDFEEVPILDAKHFHPKDTGTGKKWLGKWKFQSLE